MYEARPSYFLHERGAPKFINLGRAFKSYAKRYRSPGASAGNATQRKRDRKILAARKGPSQQEFVPHISGKTSRRQRIKLKQEFARLRAN